MAQRASYHHGDPRRTLLDTAAALIAERGTGAVSLRELARRAEVSHAAPTHHFTDKAGLFTALAVEGHALLADSFASTRLADHPAPPHHAGTPGSPGEPDARLPLRELGVRYVRFALHRPGHFAVMFRPDLCRADDVDLTAARARTAGLLRAAIPPTAGGASTEQYAVAAWSAAHGFATLWSTGSLGPAVPGETAEDAFRRAADTMFGALSDRPSPDSSPPTADTGTTGG